MFPKFLSSSIGKPMNAIFNKSDVFRTLIALAATVILISIYPALRPTVAQDGVNKRPASTMLQFLPLHSSNSSHRLERAKVPGGWLVTSSKNDRDQGGSGITFVPDPDHQWDGRAIP